MVILTANNIHKIYRLPAAQLHILQGVNLEVEQGEIVALAGPSGSGKSTLLNILGTLDRPDQGEVTINGKNVGDLGDKELSRFRNLHIGFVFQFHHLLPELTLWENLALPAHLSGSGVDQAYLSELLSITGLSERTGHYPHQLSGGERQRVAVIRALVNRPGIIFADEPTGNLDAENGAILLELIQSLRESEGQTFLIATHSHKLAEKADRRLVLENGVIKRTN